MGANLGGLCTPPNNSAASPQYFHAPHQRVEMTFLGGNLHFIALHRGGQKFGQPRGGVTFAKSSPSISKNGQFSRTPTLDNNLISARKLTTNKKIKFI